MSTTYGIFKEHPNKPDLLDCGAIGFYEYPEDLFVPIAWISNGGYCYWKNGLLTPYLIGPSTQTTYHYLYLLFIAISKRLEVPLIDLVILPKIFSSTSKHRPITSWNNLANCACAALICVSKPACNA